MQDQNRQGLKLAEKIRIGPLEIDNRIVKASMVENMATEDGEVTDQMIRFYEKQAKGGAGLLITGGAYVQKNGRSVRYLLGAYEDRLIPGLRRLTETVHGLGGKVILQIYHSGRQTRPELVDGDVVAPSRVRDRMTGVTPRELTPDEIDEIIGAFGNGAARAKEAGFDGVEVLAGHGYLISEFLAKRTNRRTDKWGGALEDRAKFLFRVIEQIKLKTGDDYPLLVKLNTEDKLRNGLTVEDSAWIAERLPDYGVHAIKLTGGTFESALNITRGGIPAEEVLEDFSGWEKHKISLIIKIMKRKFLFSEAYFLENCKKIKPRVRVPVILVGGMRTPAVMEQILRDGHADLIGIGRPLIREPAAPAKILGGDLSPVSCINCNRCFIRIIQEKPLMCYALREPAQ